jgi:hypothetical protein
MNKTMSQERIQVITGVERRRRFTAEQKMRLCEECDRLGMTVSYVALNGRGDCQYSDGLPPVVPGDRSFDLAMFTGTRLHGG